MQRILRTTVLVVVCVSLGCGQKKQPSLDAKKKEAAEVSRREQAKFGELTIRRIMQGPGLVGTPPSNPRFSADGGTIFFRWNSPARLDSLNAVDPDSAYQHFLKLEDEAGTWALNVASGAVTPIADAVADTLVPDETAWDSARRHCAQVRGGDVYLVDVPTGATRRVTGTLDVESQVQMSPDGGTAYFVRDNNLFSVRWGDGLDQQKTDLRLSDDPDKEKLGEQRLFLEQEQKRLFPELREKKKKKTPGPQKVFLGDGWAINAMRVAPSGRYLALDMTKATKGARKPMVPLSVTKSGYMETEDTREYVGDEQDETRVVIVDMPADSLIELDVEAGRITSTVSWSPTADQLLIQSISSDWHHRYFQLVSMSEKRVGAKIVPRTIDDYHDRAWVGGPDFADTGAWLPDGSAIYFLSEAEGWSHLYTVSLDGKKQRVTKGDWEVHKVWFDRVHDRWLVISNRQHPGSGRLWELRRDGSDMHLLTPENGNYDVTFNEAMTNAAVLHSTIQSPDELYVFHVAGARLDGPKTLSTTAMFREYSWMVPQLVSFRASDGERVPAHLFTPEMFGVERNGAGVIFIHGAGYLQNVIDSWGSYYREFMFNHLLAAHGYTVLNIDYRGSAGYGQKCRTAIHEHMGGRDLEDIVDGANYLVKKHGVGEHQVGTYGGSYGGFLTLMALFKHPDEIRSGGALRSVTDWTHYNHWYTVRILGSPTENPEAYRRSSPIYFAEGFKGDLVILHGLRDSNVLALDDIRLSQRLIELGKENWELALHPVEDHAYKSASSWTDQMTRVFKLFERTLPNDAPDRRQ